MKKTYSQAYKSVHSYCYENQKPIALPVAEMSQHVQLLDIDKLCIHYIC